MPGFDDIVGKYLPQNVGQTLSAQKQNDVLTASAEKQTNLSTGTNNNPLTPYELSVARMEGTGVKSASSEQERDMLTLSPGQMYLKYGQSGLEAAQLAASNAGSYAISRNTSAPGFAVQAQDATRDVGAGFVNGILDLGALAMSPLDGVIGHPLMDASQAVSEWNEGSKSDAYKGRQIAYEARQAIDSRDNLQTQKEETADYGSTVATARRVGRDFLDAASNTLDDGYLTSSLGANAIGSLLVAGPMEKGLAAVGKAALRGGMATGVVGRAGARKALQVGESLAMPATVGLQEASGAYRSTYMDAMMSLADRDDLTPEEKRSMANTAALEAAGTQGIVAAGIGKLPGFSDLERAPFRVGSVRGAVANIGKETAEEGIQSASGQFLQNAAIKANGIDPNRDLADGVGEQGAQGAIGGFASAGIVQAPGLAGRAAVAGAKGAASGAVWTANKALSYITNRADTALAKNEANSPVSNENLNRASEAASVAVPEVTQTMREEVDASDATPEQKTESYDYLERLNASTQYTPSQRVADNEDLSLTVEGAKNKFDAMRMLGELAGDEEMHPTSRIAAANELISILNENQDLLNKDLPEALSKLPQDHPSMKALDGYRRVIADIGNSKSINDAVEIAMQMAQQTKPEDVSEENINTPEGQAQVELQVNAATQQPGNSNPEVLAQILRHQKAGLTNLSPAQVQTLEAAQSLVQTNQAINEQAKAMGRMKPIDLVHNQITSEQGDPDEAMKSLEQHQKGIVSAVQAGDNELAGARLEDLVLFAQHMQNKVGAFNTAFRTGKTNDREAVSYQSLIPNSRGLKERFHRRKTGVWLSPKKASSIDLAQKVALEASMVGTLANNLSSIFPDLSRDFKIPHIELVSLDPGLVGESRQLAKGYASGEQKVPSSAVEQETSTPVAEPKETKVEPEPEKPTEEVVPTENKEENISSEREPNANKAEPDIKEVATEEVSKPVEDAVPDAPTYDSPEEESLSRLLGSDDNGKTEKGKVRNFFRRSFKVRPGSSRVILEGFDVVRRALSSERAFKAVVGDDSNGYHMPAPLIKAYSRYMDFGDVIADKLNARLQDAVKSNPDLFGVSKGIETNRWQQGKAINLMEMQDGKFQYHEGILQASVLAGLQWAVIAEGMKRQMNEADLAQMLGIDENEAAQFSDQLNDLNSTIGQSEAVQMIGQMLTRYWGVSPNPSADVSYTQGIPAAMAGEILSVLLDPEVGFAKQIQLEFAGEGVFQTHNRISFADRTPEMVQDMSALKGWPNLIETVAVSEPNQVTYIGEAPSEKDVPKFQHRSKTTLLTAPQKEMIRNANRIVNKPNVSMIHFMAHVGRKGNEIVFGQGDLSGLTLNENTRRSLEGKNRTITSAYDTLSGFYNEVLNKADGKDPSEMDVFFAHTVTSVGRLMQLGANNPQSSKLMREMFLPTRSVLDMTDKNVSDMFMLAVAQHLGEKIHTQDRAVSVANAEALLNGDLVEAAAMLSEYQDNPKVLDDEEAYALRDLLGSNNSYAAVHAIMEYTRWMKLKEAGDTAGLKAFTTSTYIEADGVTNGPMMALMMFGTGQFEQYHLDLLQKGGFMVGATPDEDGKLPSINSLGKQVDLYKEASNKLTKLLSQSLMSKRDANDDVERHFASLRGVMNTLLGAKNFTINEDESGLSISIDRGVMKNPLTVTLYGSGEKGIASKVVSAMMDKLYQMHSEVLNNPNDPVAQDEWADIQEAIKPLMQSTYVVRKDDGKAFVINQKDTKPAKGKGESLTFSGDQIKNLTTNVQNMFVKDMRGAINEVMGSAAGATTAIRRAVQAQSIFFQAAYQDKIAAALEAKKSDPEWVASEFLSQRELDEILSEIGHLAPMVSTGDQSFMMSGSERSFVSEPTEKNKRPQPKKFASTLDGKMRIDGQIYVPSDARVRGIPFMTIGPGDGQMIQNAATGPNALDRVGYVYDGVNLPLDQAEAFSQKINEAAANAALGNPLRAVLNSFEQFMKSYNPNQLDNNEKAQKQLARAMNDGRIELQLDDVLEELRQYADEIDARHAALREVGIVVDHMAGTESPHQIGTNERNQENPVLDDIQQAYAKHLDEITKNKNKPDDIKSDLRSLGTIENSSGARIILGSELASGLPEMNVSKDLKDLIKAALNSDQTKDLKIVTGTRAGVNTYLRNNGINVEEELRNHAEGLYRDNTIYLYNPSAETLAHELVHASTYNVVAEHYANPQDGIVKQSVERLEKLMSQWMSTQTDPQLNSEDNNRDFDSVRMAIQDGLDSGNKAAALNEFMAWSLSNQTISEKAKRTNVLDKLARIAATAVRAIRALFLGNKADQVGQDIFSNVRFNTKILMAQENEQSIYDRHQNTILAQNRWFGENNRVAGVREAFSAKVGAYVAAAADLTDHADRIVEKSKAVTLAQEVFEHFTANGFPMTMQQKGAFTNLISTFAMSVEFDGNTLNRLQSLYDHAISKMNVVDFLSHPDSIDPNDNRQATEKFRTIAGKSFVKTDQFGRSTLLPSFLALALVDPSVQKILSKIDMPKSEMQEDGTLDAALTNLGTRMMDTVGRKLSGQDANASNVQEGLESLIDVLVNSVSDEENFISSIAERGGNLVDKGNKWVANALSAGSKAIRDKAKSVRDANPNKMTKSIANVTNIIAAIADQGEADELAKGLMSYMNRNPQIFLALREITNELVGRTEGDNSDVVDKIKPTKAVVSKGREQFRERLPKLIAEKFSRELSDQEWTDMHTGLGKTDVLSLFGSKTMAQMVDLMSDQTKITGEVTALESQINSLDSKNAKSILDNAKKLAAYMTTGERQKGLTLYNAHAIADLSGAKPNKSDPALIKAVDDLTSLYAMEALPKGTKETLTDLAKNENEGMTFVMSYLAGLRADEVSKLEGRAVYNHYKGYVPSEQQQGVNLLVAPAADHNRLTTMGYVEAANYQGSVADSDPVSRKYYFAPVSGQAPYNQGLVQTVRPTSYGVDPMTGYSFGVLTAGRITDVDDVARVSRALARGESTPEPLRPIFNEQGKVVAYERTMDHAQEDRLNRNTHLGEMIGSWRGRQFEEQMARAFNTELVHTLHGMWERDREAGRDKEYIDVMDEAELRKDPVLADSIKLLPLDLQSEIKQLFGKDGFMVRRDMLLDTLGERAASIGDAWTGNSRFSKEAQDRIQKLAIGVFGVDAYKYAVNAEKFYQTIISDAKKNIVIKSVVVPVANLVSNVYQLSSRGVPLAHIIKGMPKKTLEIDNYVQMELQYMKYDAEHRAATASDDVVEARKLDLKMKAIRDAQMRMSIWPLIEAGEFSTISEGLDIEDGDLYKGKLTNWIDKRVSGFPEGVRTFARYGYLTQDTALFKALQKTVDYGDFIAKAILYDDMTKRQKLTKDRALAEVTEEFINYDRLRGRSRQYLESMGLMWFWNYKVRAVKIAANMIRNNPLHALLAGMAPVPSFVGSIGTPITDNIFSVMADGRLGYSIGPGQALRGFTMNPWINLVS